MLRKSNRMQLKKREILKKGQRQCSVLWSIYPLTAPELPPQPFYQLRPWSCQCDSTVTTVHFSPPTSCIRWDFYDCLFMFMWHCKMRFFFFRWAVNDSSSWCFTATYDQLFWAYSLQVDRRRLKIEKMCMNVIESGWWWESNAVQLVTQPLQFVNRGIVSVTLLCPFLWLETLKTDEYLSLSPVYICLKVCIGL